MKTKYKVIRVKKVRGEHRYSCHLDNGYHAGYFVYIDSQWHFHNYRLFECRWSMEKIRWAVAVWTDIADFLDQLNKEKAK